MKVDQWIKKHRDRFDDAEPSDKLWSEIRDALPQNSRKPRRFTMAAAAVFFIAVGLGLWDFYKSANQSAPSLPAEFLAQEARYQRDVQGVKQELDLTRLQGNSDYQWVFEELANLDRIQQQYREAAQLPVPQEELLAVLIDNYEKRLRLLRRLQMEIERNQRHVNDEKFSL